MSWHTGAQTLSCHRWREGEMGNVSGIVYLPLPNKKWH